MPQIVAPGQLVADRFQIVRFIAEGGMGEVYEADDRVLGERVALKFLNRRSIGDERVARRFRREIQLARKVTHANVCRIFDVYQHRLTRGFEAGTEVTFVTMELLAGETLEEMLLRDGPLAEEQALPLIRQMAAALMAAHAAGVIHRDFKSNNVLLVPGGGSPRVVVTDFGLARSMTPRTDPATTPLTGEMSIVGTVDYMSPEQLHGEEISPASDVYALGVVMFEMVTGAKPYSASSLMALLAKRISEPPASPREFTPGLSEHWESVILECLRRDPAKRLATPRDLMLALTGEDLRPSSEPSGSVTRPRLDLPAEPAPKEPEMSKATPSDRPPQGRRPARWPLAAAVLLLVAALGLWLGRPRPALTSFSPTRLTTSPGLDMDPALSPDGTTLVFSSDRGDGFEIFTRRLGGDAPAIQLTFDGGQKTEPAISPDGRLIAFRSRDSGGIWMVAASGGRPRRLTDFGSRPTFSPDGHLLAFQSESSPEVSETAAPALALSTLWTADIDSGTVRRLTRPGSPAGGHGTPAWSPDGRRLVFTTSHYLASEIWSMDRDGADPVAVVREPALASEPTFSPDGRKVYFSAPSREVNGLWQVAVSRSGRPTGPPAQIANLGVTSIRQLAVAGDPPTMVYTAMSTRSNLWSLPLAGDGGAAGLPRPLTSGTGRNNRPAFSPDAAWIAFDRWQSGVNVGIWLMRADGREARRVTEDPSVKSSHASWFPGGDSLAFLGRRDGRGGLWAKGLGGGRETLLTELAEDAGWARLSADGSRVAYHSRGEGLGLNLWLADLRDGSHRQLTFAEELMGFPCWSPDGEWLAFQGRQGEATQVMVVPAAGGEPEQLTTGAGLSYPFSFSPDGERIAYAGLRDGTWNLWWVSRATGEQRRLSDERRLGTYVRYPAWSPAGDQIVYELAETTGDIWRVESLP